MVVAVNVREMEVYVGDNWERVTLSKIFGVVCAVTSKMIGN